VRVGAADFLEAERRVKLDDNRRYAGTSPLSHGPEANADRAHA
jgi:hypothetical protein